MRHYAAGGKKQLGKLVARKLGYVVGMGKGRLAIGDRHKPLRAPRRFGPDGRILDYGPGQVRREENSRVACMCVACMCVACVCVCVCVCVCWVLGVWSWVGTCAVRVRFCFGCLCVRRQ